jgi:hypothetical protein
MRAPPRPALVAAALLAASARAGSNLPADDPAWDALRDQIAQGRILDPLGGVQTLDRDRLPPPLRGPTPPDEAWVTPLERFALRVAGADEHDRPYSLALRPRDLAGFIGLSCEYQEGRPCGDGAGAALELDSAAGWGELLTAATRLRASAGTASFANQLTLDRAYLKIESGPFLAQIGRDVIALGPSIRSSLMVSRNAVAQDGLRLQLHPVALPFAPEVRISLLYFIDRLRQPQAFRGTLLDCARAQLDFGQRVQLGGSRMLELGGEGAPDYGGLSGFILEHFGRTREGAGTAENNRLSFDLSVRVPELSGARVYYEIAFEDTRQAFFNSVQYDADHLLGLEVRALRLGPWRRLFIELEHTGWVSQEHWLFTSGMTNAGRTLGSALGPDGTSLWVRADLEFGAVQVSPWVEWLRFVSDRYGSDQTTGVFVTAVGPMEHRQRLGADAQLTLARSWFITGGVFGERIANADLVNGSTRYSAGLRAALVWTP